MSSLHSSLFKSKSKHNYKRDPITMASHKPFLISICLALFLLSLPILAKSPSKNEEKISKLKNELDDANKKISSLTEEKEELQSRVKSLEIQVAMFEKNIRNLNEQNKESKDWKHQTEILQSALDKSKQNAEKEIASLKLQIESVIMRYQNTIESLKAEHKSDLEKLKEQEKENRKNLEVEVGKQRAKAEEIKVQDELMQERVRIEKEKARTWSHIIDVLKEKLVSGIHDLGRNVYDLSIYLYTSFVSMLRDVKNSQKTRDILDWIKISWDRVLSWFKNVFWESLKSHAYTLYQYVADFSSEYIWKPLAPTYELYLKSWVDIVVNFVAGFWKRMLSEMEMFERGMKKWLGVFNLPESELQSISNILVYWLPAFALVGSILWPCLTICCFRSRKKRKNKKKAKNE